MTFIENELARRQGLAHESAENPLPDGSADVDPSAKQSLPLASNTRNFPQRQAATLGKLHEVDLGPDSKMRNIQRTQMATNRLAGSADSDGETGSPKGPGGKQKWKSKQKRNTEGQRRNQLVEEVLRESKRELALFCSLFGDTSRCLTNSL